MENSIIDIKTIPTLDEMVYEALAPEYLRVIRIYYVINLSLVVLAVVLAFVFIKGIQIWWLMLGAGVAVCLGAIFLWQADTWAFEYSGYGLRTHDLVYKDGWWVRRVRVVPLNRIQHLSVEMGFIERSFGLAAVSIYTAGSAQSDFRIQGITRETAQRLKDHLAQFIHLPESSYAADEPSV